MVKMEGTRSMLRGGGVFLELWKRRKNWGSCRGNKSVAFMCPPTYTTIEWMMKKLTTVPDGATCKVMFATTMFAISP